MDSDANFSQDFLNLIQVHEEFDKVKEISDDSLLIHIADKSGATLLHYSARYNNEQLAKYLLDKDCDVNIQDSMGFTPLMYAVTGKHEAVAKILLSAKAMDIFKLNSLKKSSLHMMSESSNGECSINQLLLQGLRQKCSTSDEIAKKLIGIDCPLYLVALLKDAEIIERMLEQGSQVDEAYPLSKHTGLHVAVRLNDLKSVNVLVKHGANVNALDFVKANPLYYVYDKIESQEIVVEKMEILKVLLSSGASMTSCLTNGIFSAIHVLMKGNREAIRMLIESGLDFKAKDNQSNKNVLHYLADNPDPEVVDELRAHAQKFDVNDCDKFGQSPIFPAVAAGNVYMVECLLRLGSKSNAKHNVHGTTPLYYAYARLKAGFRSQYRQYGELLLRYNADPQILFEKSDKTITIFDAALQDDDYNRIKPLVAHLAILEKLGTPIVDTIRAKIDGHKPLKEHFDSCRGLLAEQISGRVTLFHLLTSDKKKMARYLNDKSTSEKLMDVDYTSRSLSCHHRYYHNLLHRRYVEGMRYKKVTNKAALVICKLFENRVYNTHIVIDKIIDYLDDRSLRRLSLLYYQLSLHHLAFSFAMLNL